MNAPDAAQVAATALPYELRIGVTGHRTLADPEAVARAIDALLDRITAILAPDDRVPLSWTVVSPLARGADRLVASAVLDRFAGRLEVVTPFPLQEYRRDFAPGPETTEFDQLLARAAAVEELEGVGAGAESGTAEPGLDRNASYLNVGEHVVDACEILVAIWNGRRAAGIGGSACIVEYARRQQRVVLWIDSEHPDRPARMVREIAYSTAGTLAAEASIELPSSKLSPGYDEQARYCLDGAVPPQVLERAIGDVRDELLELSARCGLPAHAIAPAVTRVLPHFVRADRLARHYQRRHTWTVDGVLYLAAAGVTAGLAQVLFFPAHTSLIVLEILAMLAVFGLWRFGRRGGWHHKWLRARYLAERLRSAVFPLVAGARPVPTGLDSPLPFYRGPGHWLLTAAHTVCESAVGSLEDVLPFEPVKRFVIDGWIEDQRRFHLGNAERKTRQARRRHVLGLGLFGATLLMAVLHLTGGHHAEAAPRVIRIDLWVTFLALALPVWAGTVHAITSQMELERIAERSGRMARVLERLGERARRAQTPGQLQEVCAETAAVMTTENHEWWVLLSFQDVRLHA